MTHFGCRWAFLGLSSIAELFFKDITRSRSDEDPIRHQLVAVSTTRSVERASQWLAQQDVPNRHTVRIYTSSDEMLKDGGFDIVYISTPHAVHFLHARTAITNGRNVLLEKPAVMNKAQYDRLADLAIEFRVVFMEAMWTRYFPLTQHLEKDLLPRLGRVKRVFADYSLPLFGDPTLQPGSRFLDKSTGSGSLLDLGVYPLTWCDIALPRDDDSIAVKYAETIEHATGEGEPIDDITTIILSGKRNTVSCVVTISSSIPGSPKLNLKDKLLRKKNSPCLRIQGTKAEISLPFPPIRPETLTIQYYDEDNLDPNGFETEETIVRQVQGWGLWYQADHIANAIRNRGSQPKDGCIIGRKGSSRVLSWVDQAKELAKIKYDEDLERVW
ncbi:predicted protein [Uncinocarpus reesii 1704]|uniref:D-xylose 1-dehydrogenase (NADP(+), D-xylono-1,5-lactone-forming) n=1 Tax=Uncinocarpus reesii (strain UAMH 1704) TaxID=336963 RepID=C4JD67_UNCRE|nr:uncharacterized protein UREG_00272 [Uncinocarpus reesii 1704]EEP75426.1 predicted protein [Uncinocarpus reesii 1704]